MLGPEDGRTPPTANPAFIEELCEVLPAKNAPLFVHPAIFLCFPMEKFDYEAGCEAGASRLWR